MSIPVDHCDGSDNVFVTGFFRGTVDFDPDPGQTSNLTSNGSSDTFIARFDSSGNSQWGRSWGDSINDSEIRDHGTGIATDTLGNVFTTGLFENTVDFDQTATHAGNIDILTSL